MTILGTCYIHSVCLSHNKLLQFIVVYERSLLPFFQIRGNISSIYIYIKTYVYTCMCVYIYMYVKAYIYILAHEEHILLTNLHSYSIGKTYRLTVASGTQNSSMLPKCPGHEMSHPIFVHRGSSESMVKPILLTPALKSSVLIHFLNFSG